MFLISAQYKEIKAGILCLSLLLTIVATSVQAYAAGSWRRFEDAQTGLSLRYPAYWGQDTNENEADPELVMTFSAPITNGFIMDYEPATVELRAVRTSSSGNADIRGLAEGFQQYYLDRPHIFRAFKQEEIEVLGRPAVQFTYTVLGDEATMYTTETWQAFGDMAVNLRLSTYALFGGREDHYRSLYIDMLESLYRSGQGTLTATDNLYPLGRLTQLADPRRRSDIPNHNFTRTYRSADGLQVLYPEEWKAQPIYDNELSSSIYFSGTKRNSLPFTVTVTDLYSAFIARADEFAIRKQLSEQPDSFWLEVVSNAIKASYAKSVPEFALIRSSTLEVDRSPALQLEYRGKNAEGVLVTRREVLTVDRRVLYSFVYETGTTETQTFEKMVGAVELGH
jgi:hypothetical protein